MKYYVCLLTGEVKKAWTKRGARRYYENTYPCKTRCKIALKDVMTLTKYNKVFGDY